MNPLPHKPAGPDEGTFRQIVEASINAIAMAGMDGRLFYVNQAFLDLWRLDGAEDALGRSPLDFWEEPAQARAVMDALLHQVGHWKGEMRALRRDGSTAELELSAYLLRDADSQPFCMMASFVDVSARRLAENALEREHAFALRLLETAPVIILLLGPDGAIRYANSCFERLSGYRFDEIRGKDWFDAFLPARDRERVRALFRQAVLGVPTRGNINAIVIRGGEEREIEWNDQLLPDPGGDGAALLAIGIDVTERRRQEERLRLNEARLNEAQRIAKVGSWELDLRTNGLFWTDEVFNLFEMDKAKFEASYEAFLSLIHPEDRDKVDAAYSQSLRDRRPYAVAHRLRMADGRIKWVEERCATDFDAEGKPLVSRGTVQDITERKRLEDHLSSLNRELEYHVTERIEEVRQQHARNMAILATTPDGFFSADSLGRIRDANPAFCMMLGYSEAELLNMSIPDIEAREDPAEVLAHIEKVRSHGYDRFDSIHRRRDGNTMEVEVSVTRVDIGDEMMFYAFVRDISWRKASEASLIQARDEAERASMAKSEFLSHMSHELRTPMNAVLGFAQLLEGEALTGEQKENVREILQAGSHLMQMINDVLDLSRIESGRLSVARERVPCASLVESCIATLRPMAAPRGIALDADLAGGCAVLADPLRLRQVLINLLSNAVKYNRDGGTVLVSCRPVGNEKVCISVEDSGIGIAAEAMPRLFQPFERLESTYSGIDGAGIGLALCKRLMEMMQGTIGASSTFGSGSRFWIELPEA